MFILYIYQPLCTSRMQHKVNFLAGLNSEFCLSKTGYHTLVKEPSLPYYLPKGNSAM